MEKITKVSTHCYGCYLFHKSNELILVLKLFHSKIMFVDFAWIQYIIPFMNNYDIQLNTNQAHIWSSIYVAVFTMQDFKSMFDFFFNLYAWKG